MPFKPRIVRFDEEHAAVPTPAGSDPAAPLGASLVATVGDNPSAVETPPKDPVHDTIRGEAFDTIANWDPDDALLNDPMMQCLARQLSDDAERLAKRYPAEGWIPPAIEQDSTRPPPAAYARIWRRAIAVALGACLLIAVGPPSSRDRGVQGIRAVESAYSPDRESQAAPLPVDRVTYEDGDTAIWGSNPIDDSQFGDVQFGVLQFGDDRGAEGGVLSRPAHEALRDLLPADSHEYCDVSM